MDGSVNNLQNNQIETSANREIPAGYFPARVVAAKYGYSKDYLTRLLRRGHVKGFQRDNALREWFVDESSLKVHRQKVLETKVPTVPYIVPSNTKGSLNAEPTRGLNAIPKKLLLIAGGILFLINFIPTIESIDLNLNKSPIAKQYSQIKQTVSADILDPLRNVVRKYLVLEEPIQTYLAVDPYDRLETRIKSQETRIKELENQIYKSEFLISNQTPIPNDQVSKDTVIVQQLVTSPQGISLAVLEQRLDNVDSQLSSLDSRLQITPTVLQLPPTNTKGIGPITSNVDTVNTDTLTVTGGSTLSSLTLSNDLTVDTSTFHVDSSNNRVGIGTTVPETTFEIVGTASVSTLLVDTLTTTGNVGIGTTSPAGPLHVKGTDASIFERTDSSSALAVFRPINTAGSQVSMLWQMNTSADVRREYGRISAEITDNTPSTITGDIVFQPSFNGSFGTERMRIQGNGNVGIGDDTSPDAALDINPVSTYTGPLFIVSSGSNERFRITSGGNVGVGTTTPASRLHLEGAGGAVLTIKRSDSTQANGRINFLGSDASLDGSIAYNDTIGGAITFHTAGSTRMAIASDGNVGIGSTSPTGKLDIVGNLTGSTNPLFRVASASELFRIQENGNVGIGTTAPSNLLDVVGSGGSTSLRIRDTGVDSSPKLTIQNDNRVWAVIASGSNSDAFEIRDNTGGATRLTINTSGQVGIGTTGPGNILDIRGTDPLVTIGNAGVSGERLELKYDSTSDYGWIRALGTSGANGNLAIQPDGGNVGIGTTGPGDTLDVKDPGTDTANYERIAMFRKSTTEGTGVIFSAKNGAARIASDWRASSPNVDLVLSSVNSAGAYQEQLFLQASSGNVGIGTTNPSSTLHLEAGNFVDLTLKESARESVILRGQGSGTGSQFQIFTHDGASSEVRFLINNASVQLDAADSTADRLTLCTSGVDNGTVSSDAAGNNCDTSSERFKHDIEELDINGLDMVMQFKPSSFIRNNEIKQRPDGRKEWGFIAEEIAEVNPHLALYEEDGTTVYSISKYGIMAVLADAIQEQQGEISSLSFRIEDLETSIKNQELSIKDQGSAIFDINILFNSIVKKFYEAMNIVFEQGLLKVADIIAGKIRSDSIETKKLCLEDFCVTKDQLKALFDNSGSKQQVVGSEETTLMPELTPEPTLEPETSSEQEVVSSEEEILTEPVEEQTASESEEVLTEEEVIETSAESEETAEPELILTDDDSSDNIASSSNE